MSDGEGMLDELQMVMTDGVLVMGDGERVRRVSGFDQKMHVISKFVGGFLTSTDLLVSNRQRGN